MRRRSNPVRTVRASRQGESETCFGRLPVESDGHGLYCSRSSHVPPVAKQAVRPGSPRAWTVRGGYASLPNRSPGLAKEKALNKTHCKDPYG